MRWKDIFTASFSGLISPLENKSGALRQVQTQRRLLLWGLYDNISKPSILSLSFRLLTKPLGKKTRWKPKEAAFTETFEIKCSNIPLLFFLTCCENILLRSFSLPRKKKKTVQFWTRLFSALLHFVRLFISLLLLAVISLARVLPASCVIPLGKLLWAVFFGLSSSSASVGGGNSVSFGFLGAVRSLATLDFEVRASTQTDGLPAESLHIKPLQSLSIYWAKHRWEGSLLLHTHRAKLCTHKPAARILMRREKKKIGTHVHTDNRNRAQMKRLIKICTASNAKEKYLLGCERTSHFKRGRARARASQRCHHGDEVISGIYPANHVRAHYYHTLPALPPLPLISAPLSLGCVRSQRSLSVLTC